jgi:predicted nucleotide-binding protein (sugar kinase/HSP70/actin superfamily)
MANPTAPPVARVRDATGRLLFTKEMKKDFLLLSPQMLPIHFAMLQHAFVSEGYKFEVLQTTHRAIVDEGLRHVHNDTCYPALLVIGQLIDAVKSGKYDPDRIALIITQTGGGCRASNYIHLLRKALEKAGFSHIPIVSLNLSGMEKNPGFSLDLPLLLKLIHALLYGDLLMLLANQVRPYEIEPGATDRLVQAWVDRVGGTAGRRRGLALRRLKADFDRIVSDFAAIPVVGDPRIRVGVVGEIYVKYAPLGNNGLEAFLQEEGVEVVVPGVLDFMIFKVDNRVQDAELYGAHPLKRLAAALFKQLFVHCQNLLIHAVEKQPRFRAPARFENTRKLVRGYVGYGNKMGEGWLLTAEMLELIHSGCGGVVCTQPFGCLPNHVSGKGMMGLIKRNHPDANIVAIDYDPGASRTNQENRIKLMLAAARSAHEVKIRIG